MGAALAAVDWGTSSFRLWLLDDTGAVLGERRSGEGVEHAAGEGFASILERHLAAAGASAALPVVICGMAGSRQGWVEARYLAVPAHLSEIAANAVTPPATQREIRILPGVAQRNSARPDVMRGEEVQLLGASLLSPPGRPVELACLPGTHSKWVSLDDGRISGFSTFLTGELFELMSQRSILRHAIAAPATVDAACTAFEEAVAQALGDPAQFSNQLFAVRSAQLLGYRRKEDGAASLSGLLIGNEIAGALARHGAARRVDLIASGAMRGLYARALSIAGVGVHEIDAEEAVRAGLFHAASLIWPLLRRHSAGTATA
jgi:2-dehydro-3-deoxygalactonokinase